MPAWLDRLVAPTSVRAAAIATRASTAIVPYRAPDQPVREPVFHPLPVGRRERDDSLDASTQRLVGIFSDAFLGRTARLIDLCKSTRRYDSRLDAVAGTRVQAIKSRPYAIRPPPGFERDPEARRIAAEVARIFDEVHGFRTIIGHIAHGVLEPFSVCEHDWHLNRRGQWVSQPRWIHGNRFGWPDEETISKLDWGQAFPGEPLRDWPNKFIVHSPVAGRSDYPWHRGALRPRLMASLVKRFGFRWWLTMLERWGQPQVYVTLKTGDANLEASVLQALRNLGSDWRGIFPPDADPKTIPVNTSVGADLHAKFIAMANDEDAIAILGQNLSTETKGGSYAAALVQERVRADILASDLFELDETITDQWIRPLVQFNWPGAPCPYMEHTLASREAFSLEDAQAGTCSVDEYRQGKGHEPEADDRGSRYLTGEDGPPSPLPPPTVAPLATAEPPQAVEDFPIIAGDIWIDTTDGHRIQVNRLVGDIVYAHDLDAENPLLQFTWRRTHFLEICLPPEVPQPAEGNDVTAPLPDGGDPSD